MLIKTIDSLIKRLSLIGMVLSEISGLLLVAIVTLDVIFRSLKIPISLSADEFSGYLLVAIFYFGVSYTFREGGHIRVEIIYDRFPPKVKRILAILLHILSIVYVIVLLKRSYIFWFSSLVHKLRSPFLSNMPLYIPQFFIVIGLFILLLEIIMMTVKLIAFKEICEANKVDQIA